MGSTADAASAVPVDGTAIDDSSVELKIPATTTKDAGRNDDGGSADGSASSAKERQFVALKDLFFRFADQTDYLLMFLGTLFGAANGAIMPSLTYFFGDMINAFIDHSHGDITGDQLLDEVVDIIYIFIGLAGATLICSYMEMAFWMWTGERQTRRMRIAYIRSILYQDIGWYDHRQTGELTTRLTADVEQVQEGISDKTGGFMRHFSTFLTGFTIAFVRSWKMALVMLSVVPVLALAASLVSKFVMSLTSKGQEAYAQAGSVADECFSSIRTVHAFSGQKTDSKRYAAKLSVAERASILSARWSGLSLGTMMFVIFCSYGLGFWYGSTLVDSGEHEGGDVTVVFFGIIIGAFSLGQAGPLAESIQKARGAAYSAFKIIDRKSEIDASTESGMILDGKMKGDLKFSHVRFAYPLRPEVTVARDMDFEVPSGQTLALVGASGCGKSTVVSLLQRFYDPLEGDVLVDGINIKELNLRWWRSQIGVVSQEPNLFDTTIEENIRYGLETATLEDVITAAKAANVHKFIDSLPLKYKTMVGGGGTQLSGGQKQRIAIARALVRKPKILLLDEATSALDSESEKIVQDALDRASHGRTTIIIAHRLSTVRNADKIAVVSEGRIREYGNHDELMAIDGSYAALIRAAQQRTADGDNDNDAFDMKETMAAITGAAESPKLTSLAVEALGDTLRLSGERTRSRRGSIQSAREGDKSARSRDGSFASKGGAKKKGEEEEEVDVKTLPPIPMKRLFALNKPEKWLIVGGLAASLGHGMVFPIYSILFSEILGTFTLEGEEFVDESIKWSLVFVAFAFGSFFAIFLQNMLLGTAGAKLTTRLRSMLFSKMLDQEIGWYDRRENGVGVLTTRLASETSILEGMLGKRMGTLFQILVMVIGGLTIAFVEGYKLTLIMIACLPFSMLYGVVEMRLLSGFSKHASAAYEESGQVVADNISCIRTTVALGREKAVLAQYENMLTSPYKLGVRRSHVAGLAFGLSFMFQNLVYSVVYYSGAVFVKDGDMDFTAMMRVFAAIVFSGMGIGQASSFLPDAAKAKAAAARIFATIDRVPHIRADESGRKIDSLVGDVDLQNVQFAYPARADVEVMKSMTLHIPHGATIALVGASGCGKSTVVSLIERFYDVKSGSVLIDGVDIRELDLKWLRSQVSFVQQEPVLFAMSIRENILYGNESATNEDVETAARQANVHDFIMTLPDGYDTYVGEKGTQLSGGQKQRVAIARALLRNPKILLLDEATSALDSESEKVVQEALDRARVGRTTIIIAHRLSTIRDANVIAVVKEGAIVEIGHHDELMNKRGEYFNLVQLQAS